MFRTVNAGIYKPSFLTILTFIGYVALLQSRKGTFSTEGFVDFINNPTCRLINPSKSEIGIITKNILNHINKEVI